jgi:hypothetical protein
MLEEALRQMRASFWARHCLFKPFFIVAVLVTALVLLIGLPVFVYQTKLRPGMCSCDEWPSGPGCSDLHLAVATPSNATIPAPAQS